MRVIAIAFLSSLLVVSVAAVQAQHSASRGYWCPNCGRYHSANQGHASNHSNRPYNHHSNSSSGMYWCPNCGRYHAMNQGHSVRPGHSTSHHGHQHAGDAGHQHQQSGHNDHSAPQGYTVTESHSFDDGHAHSTTTVGEPPHVPAGPRDYNNQSFTIRFRTGQEGLVSYVLESSNGAYNFTMTPGQRQTLLEDRVWKVKYNHDGQEQVYRLRGGKEYEFRRDADGHLSFVAT